MSKGVRLIHGHNSHISTKSSQTLSAWRCNYNASSNFQPNLTKEYPVRRSSGKLVILPILRLYATNHGKSASRIITSAAGEGGPWPQLDLTEENVRQVLADARVELGQLFDASVNITGKVDLAELDGPFVKISLRGRFWHKRSTVLARLGNYLKQRIPEILEVDIEDEKQLDDSPENF